MTDGATTGNGPGRDGSAPFGPATCLVRDWREDADHENGKYWNECENCRRMFIGHKRRIWCKVCATAKPPNYQAERQPPNKH